MHMKSPSALPAVRAHCAHSCRRATSSKAPRSSASRPWKHSSIARQRPQRLPGARQLWLTKASRLSCAACWRMLTRRPTISRPPTLRGRPQGPDPPGIEPLAGDHLVEVSGPCRPAANGDQDPFSRARPGSARETRCLTCPARLPVRRPRALMSSVADIPFELLPHLRLAVRHARAFRVSVWDGGLAALNDLVAVREDACLRVLSYGVASPQSAAHPGVGFPGASVHSSF